jgi:hypothetical protein
MVGQVATVVVVALTTLEQILLVLRGEILPF